MAGWCPAVRNRGNKSTKSPYGDWLVQLESAKADFVPFVAATLVAGADFEKAIRDPVRHMFLSSGETDSTHEMLYLA